VTPTDTVSLHDQAKSGTDPAEPCLVLALDSVRLTESPWRVSLAGIDEVVIGRGPERSLRRQDRTLVITIPDVAVSALHARLRRAGAEWVVEDALEHLPHQVRAASGGTEQLQEARAGERFASLAREHGGNVSAMARALGTSRSHVRRLAQRYHVDLSAERD
jgi:hypothetical protein